MVANNFLLLFLSCPNDFLGTKELLEHKDVIVI
jgi:hypothetical protein